MRRTDFVSSVQDRFRKALTRGGFEKASAISKHVVLAIYERDGVFYWDALSLTKAAPEKEELRLLLKLRSLGWITIKDTKHPEPGAWRIAAGPSLQRLEKAAHEALGGQSHPGRRLAVVDGGAQ